MKGLSLTLSVIVVAIALIVTVLVVVTIFNKQVVQFLNTLNPWSDDKVKTSLCQDKCSTYCSVNLGETGTEWSSLQIELRGESSKCDAVMRSVFGQDADIGSCRC
jgi:hypothetical protein